jgi:2-polyprenyl-3-methyl-5-hydroxy-6-metoxy-1,4-benzoquinol methylase
LLELVAPTTFIYIERLDKVAQAVSMARAVQTGVYASWRKGQHASSTQSSNLRYDRELISNFLAKLEEQNRAWRRWFESSKINPFVVTYESLAADQAAMARGVIELLGVENDEPQPVRCRVLKRQSDGINQEWISRYNSEAPVSEHMRSASASASTINIATRPDLLDPVAPHIFDRFDQIKRSVVEAKPYKTAYLVGLRLRYRYEAVVAQNRELFRDARVLDVQSGDGRWSLAAIDAGARRVVGVESRRRPIEIAEEVFAKYGVRADSYEFINAAALSGLKDFTSGQFDLILCQEMSDLSDPHLFFDQLHRLEPKHVILDTALNSRPRAAATFKLSFKAKGRDRPKNNATRGKFVSITCIPNHELITMLSEHFGFRWRIVEWKTLGIADWAGLGDYALNHRQTYVLERG